MMTHPGLCHFDLNPCKNRKFKNEFVLLNLEDTFIKKYLRVNSVA